jgi:putative Mg2+ transporter-C (MgtC) family protein
MEIFSEEIIQLLIALVIGGVIGIEREISSKAAGFRTMILISLGSALFTIMSLKLGAPDNEDRIAANILTGIGFIGAGVVFKEGFNVVGITSAATIWITAALGMAIGSRDYALAIWGTVLTIIVLFLFEYVQNLFTRYHQHRGYHIIFQSETKTQEIVKKLDEIKLRYSRKIETKNDNELHLTIDIFGMKDKIEVFNKYLLDLPGVRTFESWI